MDPNTNTTPPVTPAPVTPAPTAAPAAPAAPQPVAAPPAPTTGFVYSGFWRRFLAALIDGVIISIVMTPLKSAIPGLDTSASATAVSYSASGPAFWVQLALTTVYAVVLLNLWQATVGKKVMGIKVTAEDGSKLPVSKLVTRELMKVVSAAILLIGYLMMLWSPTKQTLHDKVAGSVVVKK